jgi:lipopolysaccharide transport system ATP-binding protein
MTVRPVIQAKHLGKCYRLFERPQDRLKQFFSPAHKKHYREFWALSGVDLEVGQGEVVGIIGRNGSGKSTLLQLVCGTLSPTEGEINVHGRVAALLELGAGFNPEFSGRENVFLNGAILGVSRAEMEARFDEIVAFSGIGDFIDQPVKTYSSGMYVRLAFAVAVHIDPDILIIDEALSVGDGAFARKSFERIMALKEKGATILFCSHSMYQVEVLCQKALWLDAGTHVRPCPRSHSGV